MTISEIIPLTSFAFIIIGFLIMIFGFIWLAHNFSKGEKDLSFANTEEIIGEVNQMFTYFTKQIQDNRLHSDDNDKENIFPNKTYNAVIKAKNEGKTSEQIAKELNMGKGEVNLILGIYQMR